MGTYSAGMTTSFKMGMSTEAKTYGKPLDMENLLGGVPSSVYFKHQYLRSIFLKAGTKSKLNM